MQYAKKKKKKKTTSGRILHYASQHAYWLFWPTSSEQETITIFICKCESTSIWQLHDRHHSHRLKHMHGQDCMSQWCAYCLQQCVLSYKGSCRAYYSKEKKYANCYVSHSASSAEMLKNPAVSLPTCPPDALKPLYLPAHLFSLSPWVPHYIWQPFVPLLLHSACHAVCTLRCLKPDPASLSAGQPVGACTCHTCQHLPGSSFMCNKSLSCTSLPVSATSG